jgi:hypothetical protein
MSTYYYIHIFISHVLIIFTYEENNYIMLIFPKNYALDNELIVEENVFLVLCFVVFKFHQALCLQVLTCIRVLLMLLSPTIQ